MIRGGFFSLIVVLLCFQTAFLPAEEKKVRVIVDEASVYLEANSKSCVIENLKKGTEATLGSIRLFRKCWNYIYFASEKTGRIKSGYILESSVEKLFNHVKVINLQTEE